MKIVQKHFRDVDIYGERQYMSITINDKDVFYMRQGEPEDMTLSRDLAAVFNIVDMLQEAYNAGRWGEELVIEKLEITEEE